MPKASKQSASEHESLEGYEGHFEHFDGGYSVGFETYTADADLAPLFKGLPDDRCQCPHWGYVIKGQMRVSYGDREEVLCAGDLYYLPPGHTGVVEQDFECIEFSPPAAHEQVVDVIQRNAAVAQTAAAV